MAQPNNTKTQPKGKPSRVVDDPKWTETALLDLNTWIYCICLVDFDLTEGQITKFVYPFDILSNEEKTNIANLSFPDTHTSNTDVVNAKFVFRFRARMIAENKMHSLSGKRKLSYLHRHKSHPYLFGYVYFRQKPDKTIERGYFQKAIVIITPIPYIHVFVKAAEIIGSLYFQYKVGLQVLNTACNHICQWPLPNVEGDVTLPLLGHIIRVLLQPKSVPPSASILLPRNHSFANKKHPKHKNKNKSEHKNNSENGYQLVDKYSTHSAGGCFQEINIYRYFHVVLGNLWCLWELALTGQPLLVVGSSAQECSHAVLGIMSLISPITYHGDFRPYFTIYDQDFKHFCNLHDRDMLPPLILGVTNPFFLKVMPKFPHILILSNSNTTLTTANDANHTPNDIDTPPILDNNDKDKSENKIIINNSKSENKSDANNNKNAKPKVMTIHVKTTPTDQHQPKVQKNSQRAWGPVREVDMTKSYNTIISKSTPCLFPDEQVLGRLLTVSRATTSQGVTLNKNELEIEQVCILNNATLRKYFTHLTEKFLEPFQEYFQFKVPSGIWNPYLTPPNLKTFQKDSFLNMIRDIPKSFLNEIPLRTSTLPTGKRSVLVKLYSKFLKSPHFPSWFNKKRERAKRKCDKIIHKMIRKIKFERLVEGKPVREGIKMYQTIHRHMNNNNQSAKPKADLNDVLIRHRAVLRSALPSQIIEALDEQVEKMRKDQIRKRKEWQVKYQQHLKQQRAVYNLDNNNISDREESDNDNDNDINDDYSQEIIDNDSIVSSKDKLPNKEKLPRSKSFENKISKLKKKKNPKSPNKMLTSPDYNNKQSISSLTDASSVLTTPDSNDNPNDLGSSPSEIASVESSKNSKANPSSFKKVKRHKKSLFDHSSPSILASSISMGLGGGLAPNINHNIHKYHRHSKRYSHSHVKGNGITKSADMNRYSTKHNQMKRYSFDQSHLTHKHHSHAHRTLSFAAMPTNHKKQNSKTKPIQTIYVRQRASSSESVSVSSSTQKHINIKPMSKDDNYAGMSRRRHRNRNNSPRMIPHLFDLSSENINQFIHTNEAKSVVTTSFASTHDDNFKLFDNHF